MPECFICERPADGDALLIERRDGSTYPVAICLACYDELILPRTEPLRLASELIDLRNAKRRRGEGH